MDGIDEGRHHLMRLTGKIAAAYASHNLLSIEGLVQLIKDVHVGLYGVTTPAMPGDKALLVPAVPLNRSVTPDYLICLEDGQKLRSLKPHLAMLGMTPVQYRQKWRLPSDYPMVAPNYSKARSTMAKRIGFGKVSADIPAKEPDA